MLNGRVDKPVSCKKPACLLRSTLVFHVAVVTVVSILFAFPFCQFDKLEKQCIFTWWRNWGGVGVPYISLLIFWKKS